MNSWRECSGELMSKWVPGGSVVELMSKWLSARPCVCDTDMAADDSCPLCCHNSSTVTTAYRTVTVLEHHSDRTVLEGPV